MSYGFYYFIYNKNKFKFKIKGYLMKNVQKRKKALSLSPTELVFVILVGIALAYYIFQNVYNFYIQNSISSTLNSDAQNILKASMEWKERSTDSDGTYSNITNSGVIVYLPAKMELVGGNIKSMGLEQGISYTLLSDSNVVAGDSLKVFVDLSQLKNTKRLSDRLVQYAETTAADTIKKVFGNSASIVINKNATGIGAANGSLSGGGNLTDGLVGIEKISL